MNKLEKVRLANLLEAVLLNSSEEKRKTEKKKMTDIELGIKATNSSVSVEEHSVARFLPFYVLVCYTVGMAENLQKQRNEVFYYCS